MSDQDTDSDDEPAPADAFAALSDPVRVDILDALTEHHRDEGHDPIGFAALRRRVGVRDSGRFRYHLNQLRARFVERTDDGYRLTATGARVAGAILAGTYTGSVSLGPAELDSTCPFCGTPATATVRDGQCVVSCAEDHPLFSWHVPANATTGATVSEVVDLAELLAFQAIEQALAGVCTQCYDGVETTVGDPAEPGFRAVCDTCPARLVGPISFPLLVDPDVAGWCREHGYTLREDHVWEFPFVGDDASVEAVDGGAADAGDGHTAGDGGELVVTVAIDDDSLTATLDGDGRVVAVAEN
jgi:hypothetical protein